MGGLLEGCLSPRSACLDAFATEKRPTESTSESTTIDRLEDGLDHPVGVIFKSNENSRAGVANAGPGDSIIAVFSPESSMCLDIVESITFNEWLVSKLRPYAAKVIAYFSDPSNAAEAFLTMDMEFSTTNSLSKKEEGLEFSKSEDTDLFLAIGRGTVSVKATVVVDKSLYISSLTLNTGFLQDLYDFNYDGADPAFVRSASNVQAGYNTLGVGGRVYKSRVEFHATAVPIHYTFEKK